MKSIISIKIHSIDNHNGAGFLQKLSDSSKFQKALISGDVTPHFKEKDHKYFVHKLVIDNRLYYLKRNIKQKPKTVLKSLLKLQKAHSDSVLEYYALKKFQDSGLNVMEPVLYGEELIFGFWPKAGYLLVKEVPGLEIVENFIGSSDSKKKEKLLNCIATYIGKMHGKGFFHAPRVHDFIYQQDENENIIKFTMIDIDLKGQHVEPKIFDEYLAYEALSQSFYLYIRSGHLINKEQACRF